MTSACAATVPAVEYRYAYDLMGNRTRAEAITAGASQLTNYTYNIANQLISDGAQSFSYDANGRLISAGDRSYSYALNDRLIALSQPGLSATFAYNGDGVRLAQTTNGSTTRYLVDTQRRYSEVVGDITPESETWYLLGLDVIGQQQGSDWSYYAYDGLGSVRLALDISGSPSAGMRYEPYGQPAASWGTPPALGFTGEWTDNSGLLYLRARYLDPSSATFLSRDPFEGLPTRALSRNGYSWVEGNPVSRSDPSGLCWDHPMSTGAQRSQCLQAWVEYASTVLLTDETRQLLRDEDEYWGSLSYTEFARLWNDNQARPPSRTNPGSEWEQLTWAAVGAAVATGPTPDDLAWLAGALCLEALRQIALARAIALPQRQTFDFSVDDAEDTAIPIPIPIPYERRRENNDETWFHYTDEAGIADIAATGIIRANSANIVYVTRYLYTKDEVLNALFAGNSAYAGKGEYYVEFVVQDGVVFFGAGAAPEATQGNEWIHYGSLRPVRDIKYYTYVGRNPF